ncbi:2-oxo acid dehydrogenase subunit E2 [Myxococcota bacterium]|nr:2-oxo acid dehydrogenase subunit E2 [Myxococcota bacterium]
MSSVPATTDVDTLRPAIPPERSQRFGRLTRRAAMMRFTPKSLIPAARMEVLIDFEPVYAFVETLNKERTKARRITLNHVTLKAVAQALRNHVYLNYAYDGGRRLYPVEEIDIRAPVDLGDFPQHVIIRRADTLTIPEIADEFYRGRDALTGIELTGIEQRLAFFELPWPVLKALLGLSNFIGWLTRLSPKAQARALAGHREWFGSFLVSNVGSHGADGGAGVLTIPSIAACGFYAVKAQPIVRGRELVIARAGKVSVGFDHRFIDGAQATRFLLEVKRNLGEPERYLGREPAPPMFPGTIGGVLP